MNIDLKQLRELMRAVKQLGISELEVESEGERVRICRHDQDRSGAINSIIPHLATPMPMHPHSMMPMADSSAPRQSEAEEPTKQEDPNLITVTSPFVGTFYRSPSPDAQAFVDLGQHVPKGQVLCIVEAMKLMNEIVSEVSGKVEEVLMENGTAVEYGDELMRIRKG